jgi:hypothetical protein
VTVIAERTVKDHKGTWQTFYNSNKCGCVYTREVSYEVGIDKKVKEIPGFRAQLEKKVKVNVIQDGVTKKEVKSVYNVHNASRLATREDIFNLGSKIKTVVPKDLGGLQLFPCNTDPECASCP